MDRGNKQAKGEEMSASVGAFVRAPASKTSLSLRKPVQGVGINDSDYKTLNNGIFCPIYRKWRSMIEQLLLR